MCHLRAQQTMVNLISQIVTLSPCLIIKNDYISILLLCIAHLVSNGFATQRSRLEFLLKKCVRFSTQIVFALCNSL